MINMTEYKCMTKTFKFENIKNNLSENQIDEYLKICLNKIDNDYLVRQIINVNYMFDTIISSNCNNKDYIEYYTNNILIITIVFYEEV